MVRIPELLFLRGHVMTLKNDRPSILTTMGLPEEDARVILILNSCTALPDDISPPGMQIPPPVRPIGWNS
jgi:hypothetical protein